MGLKDYFKAGKEPAKAIVPPSEKPPTPSHQHGDSLEMASLPRLASSRASFSPSTRSSTFVDDIKHEVMVNFLYQQQCSHLWVSDGSGELEGVLIRKYRNQYMTCPPALAESRLAAACAALNCQVHFTHWTEEMELIGQGCNDG